MAAIAAIALFLAVGPAGIVDANLPIAGDQVTHNWWLIEFRDRLFGDGSVLGWSDALSLGYPFGYFYFPLPPIVFSALSVVLPDAMAVKLMVASSLMLLPYAVWRFTAALRVSAFVRTAAPVLVLASMFANQQQFIGGTLYATLTGEFSYAYGLAFSLLAIAAMLRASRGTGSWVLAGTWTALALLSHLQASIPMIGVVAFLVIRHASTPGRSIRNLARWTLAVVAGTAWWLLPLLSLRVDAIGDGHTRVTDIVGWMTNLPQLPLVLTGIAGVVVGLVRRRPGARLLTGLVLVGPVVLVAMPTAFLWNVRAMPWTYTMLAVAIGFLVEPLAARTGSTRAAAMVLAATTALALALPFSIPENRILASTIRASQYGGTDFAATEQLDALAEKLKTLPPGPAMMAVPKEWVGVMPARDWATALPLLTDDRVVSPISLYYEASRSTPGIEYTHSFVSEVPHTSLSWLGYGSVSEFKTGITAMRLHGIRYYLVGDQAMFDRAKQYPQELELLATVGQENGSAALQWAIFEVQGASRIEGMTTPLEVVPSPGDERAWAAAAANWIKDRARDPQFPQVLSDGPATFDGSSVPELATVINPSITDGRITFEVDQPGRPVLVKVSYSQHWKAAGAEGPWRAAPNFMVVLPTESKVTLTFTAPFLQRIAPWVSVAAALALAALWLHQRRARMQESA